MNLKMFVVAIIFAIAVILAFLGYSDKDALEMAAAAFFMALAHFVWGVIPLNV